MRAPLVAAPVSLRMWRDRIAGRKVVVWYVTTPGFVQFILPVFRLLDRRDLPIAHYVAEEYRMAGPLALFGLPPDRIFPIRAMRWLPIADAFVTAAFWGRAPRRTLKVNIGHGFYVKYDAWDRDRLRDTDVVFAKGPLEREMLESAFARAGRAAAHIRIFDVGHPKYDALFSGSFRRDDVLRGLGLDAGLPTVLYAPAWDPGASLRTRGEAVIETLLSLPDVNVVVKLHQTSLEPPESPHWIHFTGGVDWIERLSRFRSYPRFRLVEDLVIDPYLAAADVMVSDISGVSMTFMCLDKPVVVIDCPDYERTLRAWGQDPERTRSSPALSAGRHAAAVAGSLDDLRRAVERAIARPDELGAERRALAARLLYHRGRAAPVAARTLLDLLGLPAGSVSDGP